MYNKSAIVVIGLIIMSQIVGIGSAAAIATCRNKSDACRATYLCFKDYDTDLWGRKGCWGRVSGTNSDWNEFGWGNRADWFENHGTRCNARVYWDIWYGGYYWSFARGEVGYNGDSKSTYNNVESNNWYGCK